MKININCIFNNNYRYESDDINLNEIYDNLSDTDKVFDNISNYDIKYTKIPDDKKYQYVLKDYDYNEVKEIDNIKRGEMVVISLNHHTDFICTDIVGKVIHSTSKNKNNFMVIEIYDPYDCITYNKKILKCKIKKIEKIYGEDVNNLTIINIFSKILKNLISYNNKYFIMNIFKGINEIELSNSNLPTYINILSTCCQYAYI